MTIRELTIVCKPFKRKTDGKMPNKKVDLIAKYNEWVGRPAPVFNYIMMSMKILLRRKMMFQL